VFLLNQSLMVIFWRADRASGRCMRPGAAIAVSSMRAMALLTRQVPVPGLHALSACAFGFAQLKKRLNVEVGHHRRIARSIVLPRWFRPACLFARGRLWQQSSIEET
jgi:hypothetical protein